MPCYRQDLLNVPSRNPKISEPTHATPPLPTGTTAMGQGSRSLSVRNPKLSLHVFFSCILGDLKTRYNLSGESTYSIPCTKYKNDTQQQRFARFQHLQPLCACVMDGLLEFMGESVKVLLREQNLYKCLSPIYIYLVPSSNKKKLDNEKIRLSFLRVKYEIRESLSWNKCWKHPLSQTKRPILGQLSSFLYV